MIARVTLRALTGAPLADESVREMVVATARAIGERQGVVIHDVTADERSVTVSLAGNRLVATGLAAELRRLTTRWYRDKFDEATLWGEPAVTDGDEPWSAG